MVADEAKLAIVFTYFFLLFLLLLFLLLRLLLFPHFGETPVTEFFLDIPSGKSKIWTKK